MAERVSFADELLDALFGDGQKIETIRAGQLFVRDRNAEEFSRVTGTTDGFPNAVLDATARQHRLDLKHNDQLLAAELRLALAPADLQSDLLKAAIGRELASRTSAYQVPEARAQFASTFAGFAVAHAVSQSAPLPGTPMADPVLMDNAQLERRAARRLKDLSVQQILALTLGKPPPDSLPDPFEGIKSPIDRSRLLFAEVRERQAWNDIGPNFENLIETRFIAKTGIQAALMILRQGDGSAAASPLAPPLSDKVPATVVAAGQQPTPNPSSPSVAAPGPDLTPSFVSPGSFPGANPSATVNPDGTVTMAKPGNLRAPDSGGTGQPNFGGNRPPGAFVDELFRINPPDP